MRRSSLCALVLFLGAAMLGVPSMVYHRGAIGSPLVAAAPRQFEVFDGTLYRSKPDLSHLGFKPLKIIYVAEFGERWYGGPSRMQLPEEDVVKRVAASAAVMERMVAVDIEHWPLTGTHSTVQESLAKYLQIATWFHEAAPSMQMGFFGIVPMAAYGWSLKGAESVEYQSWQRINASLIPLAQEVDVVFPHIYTYYPDRAEWVRFATENIKEARRYGKSVHVFLWPRYTEMAGSLAGKDVPADYWKLQLETVRKLADGVVIWGGWGDKGPESWDEAAPWWQVTKQFLSQIDRVGPVSPKDLVVQ